MFSLFSDEKQLHILLLELKEVQWKQLPEEEYIRYIDMSNRIYVLIITDLNH